MGSRYARYVAVAGLIALVGITLYTELTRHGDVIGLRAGQQMPPFAAPLASGGLQGDVNVATKPKQGQAGRRPACQVRGQRILNLCQLYERGPVVLALFIDAGSCTKVLERMQAIVPSFPGVSFAAVALEGQASAVAKLVRQRGLTLPVAIDRDGVLGGLYRVASCPQVTFAYPGGKVQGATLVNTPTLGELRVRVGRLVALARAQGWRGGPSGGPA